MKKSIFMLVLWLTGCFTVVAQAMHYSKEVLSKIQQVEQH